MSTVAAPSDAQSAARVRSRLLAAAPVATIYVWLCMLYVVERSAGVRPAS